MNESNQNYSAGTWQSISGTERGPYTKRKRLGTPPIYYICLSCDQNGHWRADCPTGKESGKEIKRATVIARNFFIPVLAGTPDEKVAQVNSRQEIPLELACPVCNDLLKKQLGCQNVDM